MTARLPTGLLVTALLRRVNDAGGMGMVRARGEAQGGGVLILVVEGGTMRGIERGIGPTGRTAFIAAGPADSTVQALEDYWRRRRRGDPFLWVVELDIPDAERFAAETMLGD